MDCRWCDWYLCRACLPVYRAKASSIWGMLMALPAYAADKMLTDPLPPVSAGPSGAVSRRRDSRQFGCTPQELAACTLVCEFCEVSGPIPTEMELQSLWMKCSMLPPWPVAEAICEQLSWVADLAWPPKLRAIHAIDYITGKGEEARDLIDLISERAGPLLLQLASVPQLRAKAVDVVHSLRANAAFTSLSTVKSGDEESCALRIQARADTQDCSASKSTIASLLGLPLLQWKLPPWLEQDWLSHLRVFDGIFCYEPCGQEPSLVKTLRIAAPPAVDANEEIITLRTASPVPVRFRV